MFVIGASGHARILVDCIERAGEYEVAGLLDDRLPSGEERFGLPILGTTGDIPRLMVEYGVSCGVVGIGDNWSRRRVWLAVRELVPDFRFVSIIHPSAQIARDVEVGAGSVIMAGAILSPGATLGKNCVVSTNSSLGHDSTMKDHSSLSAKVGTGGNVRIGTCTAVMLDASIAHGVAVGDHTVVGAGSLVLRDLPADCVAYGAPARVVRQRSPDDPYL